MTREVDPRIVLTLTCVGFALLLFGKDAWTSSVAFELAHDRVPVALLLLELGIPTMCVGFALIAQPNATRLLLTLLAASLAIAVATCVVATWTKSRLVVAAGIAGFTVAGAVLAVTSWRRRRAETGHEREAWTVMAVVAVVIVAATAPIAVHHARAPLPSTRFLPLPAEAPLP